MKNIVECGKNKSGLRFVISSYTKGKTSRLPKRGVAVFPEICNIYVKEIKFLLRDVHYSGKRIINRFKVTINVINGNKDKLGTGDLDNYSKAILDIITKTKKIWDDDKQVDQLLVFRKKATTKSKIIVSISII